MWLDRSPFKQPADPVFPTLDGKKDNRQNVRRRLLVNAIDEANKKLVELKREPIGAVDNRRVNDRRADQLDQEKAPH